MVSVATKLHILLILTIIAVGLYMYFLYKEVRTFQSEMNNVKSQIQTILSSSPVATVAAGSVVAAAPASTSIDMVGPNEEVSCQEAEKPSADAMDDDCVDEEDDAVSITSNEIKDILTNIQSVDDEDDVQLHNVPQPSPNGSPNVPNQEREIDLGENKDSILDPCFVDDDEDDCGDEETQVMIDLTDEIILMEKKPVPDFANMTKDDINRLKYDDLRNYLRSQGVNMQGKKSELIAKIKSITSHT